MVRIESQTPDALQRLRYQGKLETLCFLHWNLRSGRPVPSIRPSEINRPLQHKYMQYAIGAALPVNNFIFQCSPQLRYPYCAIHGERLSPLCRGTRQ